MGTLEWGQPQRGHALTIKNAEIPDSLKEGASKAKIIVMTKIDYKSELNPSQLKAVRFKEGPCLVIAGAGSGKTRILVYRVAHLVESGIDPKRILLLTFTRKAAQEMLTRASRMLDTRCKAVAGGTFHSFANMVLRRYGSRAGLKQDFTIIDQADAENSINLARKDLNPESLDRRFPKKRALLNIISKSLNKSNSIEDIIDIEYPHFAVYAEEIKKIRAGYARYKRRMNLLDYDDLLIYLKELLRANDDIRDKLSQRYRYIMVDEYQDTNKLQADILYLLLSSHTNIMAVGDDSQSIYSFRGANFRNIIDFPKLFKDTKIITLEENYRSVQPILDLTNTVISEATEGFSKNLFSSRTQGNHPLYLTPEDDTEQTGYIIEKISELISQGIKLPEIAILFRAGWHSNTLEIELSRHGIPFVKYGGQKFVESAHIKDVISYMRIAHNRFDQLSWNRVLSLMRGVGPRTSQRLFGLLVQGSQTNPSDKKLIKKFSDAEKLNNILKRIDAKKESPLEIFRLLCGYYSPIFKQRYDDYHKRINDLESLERIVAGYRSLERFLTDVALEPPEKDAINAGMRNRNNSSLVLSTVHSAKGLEWHSVFIIYVAEGYIPSYQSFGDERSIEEERRLLYVAMTRAKENLFLLRPVTEYSGRSYIANNGSSVTRISRFLQNCF